MKKLLTILLSIIFFSSQAFSSMLSFPSFVPIINIQKGTGISINFTGKLTIDNNETPLVRAETVSGTAISMVYSNISGENMTIKADVAIKGGDIEIETGGMFKSERQAIPLSGSSSGFWHTSNYVNAYGLISATGKLNILSHNGVHVTGTNIIAMDGGAVYTTNA